MYSFGSSVEQWVSFEVIGTVEGIKFYVRVPSKFRNLLEASLYAQYPDIEIISAEDYIYKFGNKLPNNNYDVYGTGLTLSKDSSYPIKTYIDFEDSKEEKTLDPLANIFEAMSKLRGDEWACIQLMVSPTGSASGNDMKKLAEDEIKEIFEKNAMKKKNKDGDEEKMTGMSALTPGYQDIIKAIEHKSSKFPFEASIRFLYIDKKDSFNKANISSIMGAFHQFNTLNMNSLKNDKSETKVGGWLSKNLPDYKKAKLLAKKRMFFEHYATRRFGAHNHTKKEDFPIFSTEELATLFHFPRSFVGAPGLKSVYSRKGGPPSNLPLE